MCKDQHRRAHSIANVRKATALFSALAFIMPLTAHAGWLPSGLSAAQNVPADVCTRLVAASIPDGALRRRRERWTYTAGTQRIAVDLAVRDDDFRSSLSLGGLTYAAGRNGGVRWRADGNGIVHGVEADLQSDAADRAPQALFPIDATTCTVAGQALGAQPTWVVKVERDGDKPAYLYVDPASGTIVREVMRDGKQIVTTVFDRFKPFGSAMRATHWRLDDGVAADAIDAGVDAVEPAAIVPGDVAIPVSRGFGDPPVPDRTVDLNASFKHGRISIPVGIDGKRRDFVLDTGTTSITVDSASAKPYGGATLGHCALPLVTIGSLRAERVSALTVPFYATGILGLDFFFGHVVEIDYLHERVRILDAADAQAVFNDSRTTIVDANVDQGLPLVRAAFGSIAGNAFALDTGSPRLYVMRPFVTRFAPQIAARWTKAGSPFIERYLEGGIELQPYVVDGFTFAGAVGNSFAVGAQVPTKLTDDLDIPFDGIIGTQILRNFDLFLDYDRARIGLRRG